MAERAAPDYADLTFPPPPPGRPYVILNMVTSIDGRAAVDGSEAGLGSSEDRRLMRELRSHADVILVGAGTLRATGASPRLGNARLEAMRLSAHKPRLPIAAVLSRSGDLPLDRAFFTATDFEAIVFLSDRCPPEKRAAIAATGRTVVQVPDAAPAGAVLEILGKDPGAARLLLEGGPGLNALFLREDAVDEVFLTIGPVLVGGEAEPIVAGRAALPRAVRPMELVSCFAHAATGEVFLRYRRVR